MLNSGFIEFKLDCAKTKHVTIDNAVYSGNFSAGGHVWRAKCYPRGQDADMDDSGDHLSLYLELVTHATNLTSVFDAFLLRRDGALSPAHQNQSPRGVGVEPLRSAERRHLGSPDHLAGDGRSTFVCGVIILRGGSRCWQRCCLLKPRLRPDGTAMFGVPVTNET